MATRGGSARSTSSTRSGSKTRPSSSKSSKTAGSQGRGGGTRAELRAAVEGREHEFVGVALIAGGILVGLAIYFKLAGVVGRAFDRALGWLCGLGRYAIPVVLVASGVALVRQGRSDRRVRLVVGWGALGASVLALLHIFKMPNNKWSDLGPLGRAGGWLGALVGVPVRSLIGDVAAVVLLVTLAFAAVLLITGMSISTISASVKNFFGAVVAPVGRGAKRALGGMSTLSSESSRQSQFDPGIHAEIYDADSEEVDPSVPQKRIKKSSSSAGTGAGPVMASLGTGEQGELDLGPGAKKGQWILPPSSFLVRSGVQTVNKAEVEARGRTLVDSLYSHGVETKLVGMTVGPTVTRYELELGAGVKVARVTSLNRDIAYAMAAIDVRILAPIPGRSAIGVEVPNHTRQLVSLGDIMFSAEAKAATHPLDVAIGKDIAGRSVFLNLATTPHLLIAGATGAGKSSGINCIITSMLMRSTPDQVRLILVDPKQVEMGQYNRLPHLLTAPVTNPKKAANALGWACKEMDRRYDILSEVGFRDITGYNAAFDRGELQAEPGTDREPERLPYIVIVVDELNDLMMVAARDVEDSITRIAQKARAIGIHLIVATQRPSVNVITGVIKANVPARVAYAVSSLTDSRVILDQPGAEKLVGKGDMLLLPGSSNVAQRIQGSFVSEEEVRKIVGHWRRQTSEVATVAGIEGDDNVGGGNGLFGMGSGNNSVTSGDPDDDDNLSRQAMELVVRSQLGSTSMLQRKLKVGFARAGRIMDLLEQGGVVGPSEGSKARAVLMSVEEFELLQEAERNRA